MLGFSMDSDRIVTLKISDVSDKSAYKGVKHQLPFDVSQMILEEHIQTIG
jgi:hypothetical protein